jgi:hypothetical protein
MFRHCHQIGHIFVIATLLLTACTDSTAPLPSPESLRLSSTAPITLRTPIIAIQPTSATAGATSVPAQPSLPVAPTPTMLLPNIISGQTILQLAPGSGTGQVGISGQGAELNGPRTFRIGVDGTIRLLDSGNKRLLFFTPDGMLARAVAITAAQDPVDFVVNPQGHIFVFDRGTTDPPQVVRYRADGTLAERFPVHPAIGSVADGIMLTADQDLLLIQHRFTFINPLYWVIVHEDTGIATTLQPLTQQEGSGTPRSPAIFHMVAEPDALGLDILRRGTAVQDNLMHGVMHIPVSLPRTFDIRFFNVDRAMNLYFASDPALQDVGVWRVAPNGTVIGGAFVHVCAPSWRRIYVDQIGTVWTMCVAEQGVTVMRHPLQDFAGRPLPDAATLPADVPWKPEGSTTSPAG